MDVLQHLLHMINIVIIIIMLVTIIPYMYVLRAEQSCTVGSIILAFCKSLQPWLYASVDYNLLNSDANYLDDLRERERKDVA